MTTFIEPMTTARRTPGASASAGHAPVPPRSARDASIDVARAWCLVVVVGLHALMVGVSVADGAPLLENAMDGWGGFAALTWAIQVMPLFFVLGGFSSVTQWTRLRADGMTPGAYVAMRMRRLLPPALGAMVVTAVALLALTLAGVAPDVVAVAGFRMSQPLWFLGVYLLCTGLVPLMTAVHRAAPRLGVGVLAALVVGTDAARIGTGMPAVGFANLLFVWLLLQQLGFLVAAGRVPAKRSTLLLVAGGALGTLGALCASGVYSPDLFENLNPPTAALVLLGVAQLCLFELARPALRRAHGIRAVSAAVGAVNARAMTIYSWHMLVLIGFAGLLLVTVGDELPALLSADWWATRPLWFAAVAAGVALLVALAGRREAAAGRARPTRPAPMGHALSAFVLAAAGVVLVLLLGAAPAAWFAGALLLIASLRGATRSA